MARHNWTAADLPGGSYAGPDGPGERRGYPTIVRASQTAQDSELARRLWDASSRLTGTGQFLSSVRQEIVCYEHVR